MATQNKYMYIGVESRRCRDNDFDDPYEWDDWQYSADVASDNCIFKYFPTALRTFDTSLEDASRHNLYYCQVTYAIPNENIPADYKERVAQFEIAMNANDNDDTYYCHIELPTELRLQQ